MEQMVFIRYGIKPESNHSILVLVWFGYNFIIDWEKKENIWEKESKVEASI